MSGSFTRSAERLKAVRPKLVRNSGGGSFDLASSPLTPQLSGRCRYREDEVNAGPISVTPNRLGYRCRFERDGRRIDAALSLHDRKPALGTLHGRDERIGRLFIEGQEIAIQSVHRDQAGGLPAPNAIGYMFTAGGREVGAIDINGAGKTLYVPRDPKLREAVIAAGLALAIFWDPAVVQN